MRAKSNDELGELQEEEHIMNIFELFVLAIGLSMDAFAVSICKGLSLGKIKVKHMCMAGLWFGGFQALMPLIGYYLGSFFCGYDNQVFTLDSIYTSLIYRW